MRYAHEKFGNKIDWDKIRIPWVQCTIGRLYRLDTRNLGPVAVCDGINGFLGLRRKFGSIFIDHETHHELSDQFGTASPWEELSDEIPLEIRKSMEATHAWLKSMEATYLGPAGWQPEWL